jgi:hypothetical protein
MIDYNMISGAAVLGSATIGATLSFVGSWLVQQREVRAQWVGQETLRRGELYKEFIQEASMCYIDALQNDRPNLASLVLLYEKISRMRVISSPRVLAAAEQVLKRIVDALTEPPVTFTTAEIRSMLDSGSADVLRHFAESCRAEFEVLQFRRC